MLPLFRRIKEARELTGLSRADLARRVGVKPSAAAQWEYDDGTAPSVANLAKIAAITNVAFEWLATGRGSFRLSAEEIPAVRTDAFAQTIFEERMLNIARSIPLKLRDPILSFLEAAYSTNRNATRSIR